MSLVLSTFGFTPSLVAGIVHHPCSFVLHWLVFGREVEDRSRDRQVVSVGSTGCPGLSVICCRLHCAIDRQQEQEW